MKKVLFGLLIILYGCNNQKSPLEGDQRIEVISKKTHIENLKVNSDISFVQIETLEECLIGYIINIEVTKDFIYILDRKSFFVFTNDGKFIKKTKRGRGPGELTRALNFSVDVGRNEIYIIEMGNLLHVYNLFAEYKETFKLDGSFIDALRVDDENFLLYTALPSKYVDFLISKYNISTRMITDKYIPYKDLPMNKLSIMTYNNFFVNNNEIVFSSCNSRKIYKYTGDTMLAYYTIDFKDLEPPASYFNRFEEVRDFRKMALEDNYVGFIYYSYDFGKFLLIGFQHKDYNCGIKFRDENTLIMSTISDLFDLPKTSSFQRPYSASRNQIHFVYLNDILLNDNLQKEEMVLEIHDKTIPVIENNNPIIVTLKIKE
jgi:hypothetical protein